MRPDATGFTGLSYGAKNLNKIKSATTTKSSLNVVRPVMVFPQ